MTDYFFILFLLNYMIGDRRGLNHLSLYFRSWLFCFLGKRYCFLILLILWLFRLNLKIFRGKDIFAFDVVVFIGLMLSIRGFECIEIRGMFLGKPGIFLKWKDIFLRYIIFWSPQIILPNDIVIWWYLW